MLIFVQKIQTKNQIALCPPPGGLVHAAVSPVFCLSKIIDAAETAGGMNWYGDQELNTHLNMAVNV